MNVIRFLERCDGYTCVQCRNFADKERQPPTKLTGTRPAARVANEINNVARSTVVAIAAERYVRDAVCVAGAGVVCLAGAGVAEAI